MQRLSIGNVSNEALQKESAEKDWV